MYGVSGRSRVTSVFFLYLKLKKILRFIYAVMSNIPMELLCFQMQQTCIVFQKVVKILKCILQFLSIFGCIPFVFGPTLCLHFNISFSIFTYIFYSSFLRSQWVYRNILWNFEHLEIFKKKKKHKISKAVGVMLHFRFFFFAIYSPAFKAFFLLLSGSIYSPSTFSFPFAFLYHFFMSRWSSLYYKCSWV